METYRHGDMIFRKVEQVPDGEQMQLADAEASQIASRWESRGGSGHTHAIATEVRTFKINFIPFVVIPMGGAMVVHPEHPALALPQGTYMVDHVRSVTPEAIRDAID
jgi:hypothetical protein